MPSFLDPLGSGRIFRDRRTGALIVDEDSIGRRGFAGEDPELGDEAPVADLSGGDQGDFEGEGDAEDFGARDRRPRG